MANSENGIPVGFPVADWAACKQPPRTMMQGRFAALEPLDVSRHADDLFQANSLDTEGRNWTYLNADAFDGLESY
jgi:hypothetical protein